MATEDAARVPEGHDTTAVVDRPARPERRQPERPGRPPVRLAWVTAGALAVSVVLAGLGVGAAAATLRLLTALQADPLSADPAMINRFDLTVIRLGITQLVLLPVTGVLFISWLFRSYRVAHRHRPGLGRHRPGWAIGGWLVPLLHLVRPKQIVDDLWHMTAREAPTVLQRRSKPAAITTWWAAFLGSVFLARASRGMLGPDVDIGALQAGSISMLLSEGASVVAGCLAIWLVLSVTRRQQARHDGVLSNPTAAATRETLRPAWPVALGGVAMAAAVALTLVAPVTGNPVGVPLAERDEAGRLTTQGAVLMEELVLGDCFDTLPAPDPAAAVVGVLGQPCDQPHMAEVYALLDLPHQSGTAFPGEETVFEDASRGCHDEFEPTLGVSYEAATDLDIFVMYPSHASWAMGDRAVLCSVYRIDEAPLQTG